MALKKKVAIVTGSSRGIGKAIALALAKEGASVVVAARSETEGRIPGTIYKTAEQIRALGVDALPIKFDVTKEEEVNEMVKKALEHFGRIDILVNNVGVGIPGNIVDFPTKKWDLIMNVNLKSVFLCTRAVLPTMIKQKSGSIINMSSVAGTRHIGTEVPYATTKAAIERFTMSLALQIKEHNIAVNALCPAMTNTEGFKLLNVGRNNIPAQEPELWGRYAAFLAHQDASGITGRSFAAEEMERIITKSP